MRSPVPERNRLLADLVATASISSVNHDFDMGNLDITNLLANWCESAGFTSDVKALETPNPKANLIASLGSGTGGLVLSGHTDTVPFDEGHWDTDPFVLQEKDGKLYGLGIADMKCFFAFALEAACRFKPADIKRPLYLIGTADEESSMSGGRALVKDVCLQANYAVIGEPTNMQPVRRHKGIFMELVRVIGKSGHSSNPMLGNNALEGMAQVIDELLLIREALRKSHNHPDFKVTYPTLNMGHIHGGDNPNRICPSVELHFDCRTLPGMDVNLVRQEIQARIFERMAKLPFKIEFETLFQGVNAMETDKDSAIVQVTEEIAKEKSGSVAFCTEGPFFHEMGIDTIIIGPGDINQAHQPNEFIELSNIDQYVNFLESLIYRFCVEETPF